MSQNRDGHAAGPAASPALSAATAAASPSVAPVLFDTLATASGHRFGRVTLTSAADNKPVAMVSSAFAILRA